MDYAVSRAKLTVSATVDETACRASLLLKVSYFDLLWICRGLVADVVVNLSCCIFYCELFRPLDNRCCSVGSLYNEF